MLLLKGRLWKYSTSRAGWGQTPTAKYVESMMVHHPTGQIQLKVVSMEHLEPVAPSGWSSFDQNKSLLNGFHKLRVYLLYNDQVVLEVWRFGVTWVRSRMCDWVYWGTVSYGKWTCWLVVWWQEDTGFVENKQIPHCLLMHVSIDETKLQLLMEEHI